MCRVGLRGHAMLRTSHASRVLYGHNESSFAMRTDRRSRHATCCVRACMVETEIRLREDERSGRASFSVFNPCSLLVRRACRRTGEIRSLARSSSPTAAADLLALCVHATQTNRRVKLCRLVTTSGSIVRGIMSWWSC